jgi:hypothetical protein
MTVWPCGTVTISARASTFVQPWECNPHAASGDAWAWRRGCLPQQLAPFTSLAEARAGAGTRERSQQQVEDPKAWPAISSLVFPSGHRQWRWGTPATSITAAVTWTWATEAILTKARVITVIVGAPCRPVKAAAGHTHSSGRQGVLHGWWGSGRLRGRADVPSALGRQAPFRRDRAGAVLRSRGQLGLAEGWPVRLGGAHRPVPLSVPARRRTR